MRITVEFLSMPVVTRITGAKTLSMDLSGNTVGDLLNQLAGEYGEQMRRYLFDGSGRLDMAFRVHLNKKDWVPRDRMDRTLNEGDHVTLMMLVGGG